MCVSLEIVTKVIDDCLMTESVSIITKGQDSSSQELVQHVVFKTLHLRLSCVP